MIELINKMLSVDDFYNTTENIQIAKGKYKLTTSFKEARKQRKRYK